MFARMITYILFVILFVMSVFMVRPLDNWAAVATAYLAKAGAVVAMGCLLVEFHKWRRWSKWGIKAYYLSVIKYTKVNKGTIANPAIAYEVVSDEVIYGDAVFKGWASHDEMLVKVIDLRQDITRLVVVPVTAVVIPLDSPITINDLPGRPLPKGWLIKLFRRATLLTTSAAIAILATAGPVGYRR